MYLESNNHSVFSMHFHLVLVVKYRRKVINDDISKRLREIFEYIAPNYKKRLREIFEYIAPNYNISIEEWNHDIDHVHVLFKAEPNSELSKFLNAYKSASSRLIKKEYPEIRQKLWKEYFWSKSFCLITTGGVTIDVIKEYIKSQGEDKPDGRRKNKQSNQI